MDESMQIISNCRSVKQNILISQDKCQNYSESPHDIGKHNKKSHTKAYISYNQKDLKDLTHDRKTTGFYQRYTPAPMPSFPVVGLMSSDSSSTVRCKVCKMVLKNKKS